MGRRAQISPSSILNLIFIWRHGGRAERGAGSICNVSRVHRHFGVSTSSSRRVMSLHRQQPCSGVANHSVGARISINSWQASHHVPSSRFAPFLLIFPPTFGYKSSVPCHCWLTESNRQKNTSPPHHNVRYAPSWRKRRATTTTAAAAGGPGGRRRWQRVLRRPAR
jgi:hypothetical protein